MGNSFVRRSIPWFVEPIHELLKCFFCYYISEPTTGVRRLDKPYLKNQILYISNLNQNAAVQLFYIRIMFSFSFHRTNEYQTHLEAR